MWKDLLLGILSAYVLIDLMMHYTMKSSMPSVVKKMSTVWESPTGIVAIVVGVLFGLFVWYISKTTETYEPEKKIDSAEESHNHVSNEEFIPLILYDELTEESSEKNDKHHF